MKRILATLAFIVALAGGSVLLAQKANSASCDPTCCDGHKASTASCAKTQQATVASTTSCNSE